MSLLEGCPVLITAGPTYEPIDPVRFIGNHSTGKMGYALAAALAEAGARVVLVSGPTALPLPHPSVELIKVMTADQMHEMVTKRFPACRVAIFAAAVADYKPLQRAEQKIKKSGDSLTLELVRNVDIAAAAGKAKQPGQLLVGFALETEQELPNARQKLATKNLDLMVLNSLQNPGAGFGHDTNQVTILDANGAEAFGLKSKQEVALDIVAAIEKQLSKVQLKSGGQV